MARRLAILLAALLFPQTASAQDPRLADQFGEEITVSLISMTVRAVDGRGHPITGLGPEDFRVRVGKKEVPVVGVDWFSSAEPAPAAEAPAAPASEPRFCRHAPQCRDAPWGVSGGATSSLPFQTPRGRVVAGGTVLPRLGDAPRGVSTLGGPFQTPSQPAAKPAGKLVVFWVQADLNPTRISGQLRLRPYTEELLATIHPADRMAVISFDSHLRLRQDFTRDREAVYAAIDRGMLFGDSEMGPGSGEVSLTGSFDFEAAVAAASPERGLELTAEALSELPGEKIIVYLGWGLGRFGSFGVQMTPAFYPAVRALRRANIPVFVLDVTSADYHSLEVGLESVAHATGGTYAKTNVLTGLATDFLANAISGHYVVTIDPESVSRGGPVTVELRNRKGSVITRPVTLR